ncbi:transglycosylase SLT domain-containing protein [Lysobacter sp. 1R34A]|uniref:lytic transglycosylase domain-containing protein n=1 Tax=Lysobacter sp. 1R34A TaxID=3445786 RepID=UPI003EEE9E07
MRAALLAALWLGAACASPALAAEAAEAKTAPAKAEAPTGPTRNGREIYRRFREGLADPSCEPGVSTRWRQHFAAAPKRLARSDDDLLPLFGYVVDALREAHLPTEYALIPFVESGYRPGARSAAGPAGLWQMIALTARNHRVPMREGYDGRLSPVDSTQAAVRYLKTLHGMFGGDWRLAVMAYNAGEYRILNALKRNGQTAANARPDQLTGLSDITQAYVRKLHALSCLMEQADDRDEWLQALDRPVPYLQAVTVPAEVGGIDAWAARTGQDAAQLRRLNPVFANGTIGRSSTRRAPLLAIAATANTAPAPLAADQTLADIELPPNTRANASDTGAQAVTTASVDVAEAQNKQAAGARRHTVGRGDNAWTIAKRYRIRVADLLERNGLNGKAVLKPGQALLIDAQASAD